MYLKGRNIPHNFTEAIKWLERAADAGYADAHYQLARIHMTGQETIQNYFLGFRCLTKAAALNHKTAQLDLAIIYAEGNGIAADLVEAYRWSNLAASNGCREAISLRDKLLHSLTINQINEAQKRSLTILKQASLREVNSIVWTKKRRN